MAEGGDSFPNSGPQPAVCIMWPGVVLLGRGTLVWVDLEHQHHMKSSWSLVNTGDPSFLQSSFSTSIS